jgi:hypothetical protein
MGDLAPEVMDNEDGVPIVKPGEEPTPKQKLAAVAYLLAIAAVVVWLLFLRCLPEQPALAGALSDLRPF